LFRGLELVTGGQRLHLYADYLAALAARGIDAGDLAGFLEAFAYGMPPHGGFALGLERWVAQIVGAAIAVSMRHATTRAIAASPRQLWRVVFGGSRCSRTIEVAKNIKNAATQC
jgi:nondiscriminating aspartyl-tRNA synthetase